jgi:hypothetical protein
MKNLVKSMDKTSHGLEYVRNNFPNLSDAKIKEGIFIGLQIRELMQDKQFDEDLNETEGNVWLSFKRICNDLLGNHKATDYQDVVQDLVTPYQAMGCNIESIFWSHTWIFFPQKILVKSVMKHSERFHQDIMVMEKRYQDK